jgi:hypothetical protein
VRNIAFFFDVCTATRVQRRRRAMTTGERLASTLVNWFRIPGFERRARNSSIWGTLVAKVKPNDDFMRVAVQSSCRTHTEMLTWRTPCSRGTVVCALRHSSGKLGKHSKQQRTSEPVHQYLEHLNACTPPRQNFKHFLSCLIDSSGDRRRQEEGSESSIP